MRERERERIKHLVSDNKPDQTERESSCYQLEHINFLFEFRIPKQKKISSRIYQCFRYDKWKAKVINFLYHMLSIIVCLFVYPSVWKLSVLSLERCI